MHVEQLVRTEPEDLPDSWVQPGRRVPQMAFDQVVQPPAEPRNAVRELVGECALPSFQLGGAGLERAVEAPAALGFQPRSERRSAPAARSAQSSIPVVGEEGTAISLDGMRPARNASRPAIVACFIA